MARPGKREAGGEGFGFDQKVILKQDHEHEHTDIFSEDGGARGGQAADAAERGGASASR